MTEFFLYEKRKFFYIDCFMIRIVFLSLIYRKNFYAPGTVIKKKIFYM